MRMRPRRMETEVRRSVILTAGRNLVRAKGFANLSLELVAAWCEVPTSRSLVRHYFANRRTLAQAIIEDARLYNDAAVIRRAAEAREKTAAS